MHTWDLHHDCSFEDALASLTIGSNTTTNGIIIDRAGFQALEFGLKMGTITDGAYAVKLEHGDDSGLSDAADVDAAEQLGDADFADTEDDTVKRLGYIGKKRYVRIVVTSTGVTTGATLVAALALLAHASHQPVAD